MTVRAGLAHANARSDTGQVALSARKLQIEVMPQVEAMIRRFLSRHRLC